ncbi:hypothetical protein FGADI_9201 [Fusarium gaditjirri]|uniref:Uncharacterized protein n=1 Tax=Fusarium gaditjirri TaxID=282569 RepID=A0A8H4WSQ8_9HYPO|nr:hypothetical protein FGADI_9201 [Fusarium gaditjirri]
MAQGDVPSDIVGKVSGENQQILDLIDELAAEKQQNKAQLEHIFDKIYRNIPKYGSAQSVEARVYDGCRGLLNTIKAILKLPGTDFAGARMSDEELADLREFCTELDDVLLGALRTIWTRSGQTESFDWAFTEHHINTTIGYWDAKIAACLSLEEYKRRFRRTQKGVRYYYCSGPGPDAPFKLYTGPKPRWDREEGTGLDPKWYWDVKGLSTPITGDIRYNVSPPGRKIDRFTDRVFIFRRSWQFCLDAQQIAEGNLGKQRQELLAMVLLRHGIPREVRKKILSYDSHLTPHREPFPYIKNLDIGAAYTPFPTVGERCLDCEKLDENSTVKRTCPQASLYVWNLALRCFHSFHKNASNEWSLCSHGSDCKGHHDCSDHSWAVSKDPEFTLFIEKEASRGNDEFISLDQAGLGPVQRIRLSKAQDDLRAQRLCYGQYIYFETHRDWEMVGGLGGLVDSMLHGKVLTKAWGEENGDGESGTRRNPAQWALGRNMLAQRDAEKAIKDLHSGPGPCEWCS